MNNTQSAYHKIKSLEVKGGFFDGIKIKFDDNLNCLIGGRGTGKTTVIEFIRYALDKMPDKHLSQFQFKSIDGLIQNNLGSGQLRLEIETLNGLSYTIQRSFGEEMLVLGDDGNPANISLDTGIIFNVEIYSQNEIENIANDSYFQLRLIDKFISEDILEIERDTKAIIRELDQNALEILQLKKDIDTHKELLSELPNITEKLKTYETENGKEVDEIQKEGNLRAIRDKEERCIKDLSNFVDKTTDELKNLNNSLSWQLEECFEEDVFQGENKDLFEKLKKTSEETITIVCHGLEDTLESLQSIDEVLQENKEELITRHTTQEKRYSDLLQVYEMEKDKARERDQLIKKESDLLIQKKRLDRMKNDLKGKNTRRQELIGRLSELRDTRYAKRTKVASMINSKLSPTILVNIEQFGNSDKYRNILSESMKGSTLKFTRIVENTVKRIPPQDLALWIQKQDIKSITRELEIDEERASKLITQLRDSKNIFDIETVELYDKPIIELKDGQDYKDSSQLSTGQKCTTILPILLLESTNPLLVDQPEDNLDNAFIYETVVKSLKDTKGNRQLIFVTHNPNIPVLGDSERVFVLRSSGRKGNVEVEGNVDEVKEQIEILLEGGKEAFQLRKKRYGY